MNLYQLLNSIQSKKIEVTKFQENDGQYDVTFNPHSIFYQEYNLVSLAYKEWDETFYIVASKDQKKEFFKCTNGEAMKVSVS